MSEVFLVAGCGRRWGGRLEPLCRLHRSSASASIRAELEAEPAFSSESRREFLSLLTVSCFVPFLFIPMILLKGQLVEFFLGGSDLHSCVWNFQVFFCLSRSDTLDTRTSGEEGDNSFERLLAFANN